MQDSLEELSYGIVLGVKENYQNKRRLELVYSIASSYDGENWLDGAQKRLSEALSEGYVKALEGHTKWWHRYWGKSSIDLPDKMFEKQWYLTNYLFGSASRKGYPPMPLQGVWTADEGSLPPWKGDYHNDLNTQMSYMHYLKANHLEEGESFIDFL